MKTETSNETRLREDICRFGRSLFERGLTPGPSGNISVRLDCGGWLVTPPNAPLGFLDWHIKRRFVPKRCCFLVGRNDARFGSRNVLLRSGR